MSQEVIRQAVVTAVELAKVGAPTSPLVIEYDNRIIVDTQTHTLPFLRVSVVFMDGFQADLSNTPIHRFVGQIHIAAAVKTGAGSSDALKLLDFFYPQLQRKALGVVRTLMAKPAPTTQHLGWSYHTMLIPFWSDKIE